MWLKAPEKIVTGPCFNIFWSSSFLRLRLNFHTQLLILFLLKLQFLQIFHNIQSHFSHIYLKFMKRLMDSSFYLTIFQNMLWVLFSITAFKISKSLQFFMTFNITTYVSTTQKCSVFFFCFFLTVLYQIKPRIW